MYGGGRQDCTKLCLWGKQDYTKWMLCVGGRQDYTKWYVVWGEAGLYKVVCCAEDGRIMQSGMLCVGGVRIIESGMGKGIGTSLLSLADPSFHSNGQLDNITAVAEHNCVEGNFLLVQNHEKHAEVTLK